MQHKQLIICSILPPHILIEIEKRGTPEQKAWAQKALLHTQVVRENRQLMLPVIHPLTSNKQRFIYDAHHKEQLPGALVRKEGDAATHDAAVDEAYHGTGETYDLYKSIFHRNSIDNHGMALTSTVHYNKNYDNAFWNGEQMVYGDGDGEYFERFTKPIDVTGHELTHGVTQYSANLDYHDQSGALNESFSDVFGILVKQRYLKQTADKADWLIGVGLFSKKIHGVALRSMIAPGTAYDDPLIGKDPQPAVMKDYKKMKDDNGGVHINSGIPNHAFALASIAIGGYAWEKAGHIWYVTLTQVLKHDADFKTCAAGTQEVAKKLFGTTEHKAVKDAWQQVGIVVH